MPFDQSMMNPSVCSTRFLKTPRPSHTPNAPTFENRVERSEEHTSELQSPYDLVCRLLLEKKKQPTSTSALGPLENQSPQRIESGSPWTHCKGSTAFLFPQHKISHG